MKNYDVSADEKDLNTKKPEEKDKIKKFGVQEKLKEVIKGNDSDDWWKNSPRIEKIEELAGRLLMTDLVEEESREEVKSPGGAFMRGEREEIARIYDGITYKAIEKTTNVLQSLFYQRKDDPKNPPSLSESEYEEYVAPEMEKYLKLEEWGDSEDAGIALENIKKSIIGLNYHDLEAVKRIVQKVKYYKSNM